MHARCFKILYSVTRKLLFSDLSSEMYNFAIYNNTYSNICYDRTNLMLSKNDENWRKKYLALRSFVAENGRLPDKRLIENRGLLNWWKYNKKCFKTGSLDEEKRILIEVLKMRLSDRAASKL